jgi:hypothetical protein
MIRDPSDGTIKEVSPEANQINAVATKTATKEIGPDTGIRQPTRTDAMQRLDKSREWLRKYHAKKERQHERGNGIEQELQAAGHSVESQREAEPASPARSTVD